MTKLKKILIQNILSKIFMMIVFVGALGVGVSLLLSEILYPEIDGLLNCPVWYQIFMYVSLAVAVVGIVGCGFTKNRKNTSMIECYIELIVFWVGLVLEIVCALVRTESYVLDIIICIGGAISIIGFSCGIGSFIGRLKKLQEGQYEKIYYSSIPYEYIPALPNSAKPFQIIQVEKYFETPLPTELVDFLLEFNGDGNFLFSTNGIVDTTRLMREKLKDTTIDGVNRFCFFGADAAGEKENLFCYKILDDGSIKDDEIFLWDHKTNETKLVATTLPDLINKYYNNELC